MIPADVQQQAPAVVVNDAFADERVVDASVFQFDMLQSEIGLAGGEDLLVGLFDTGHLVGIHHVVSGRILAGAEQALALVVAENVTEIVVDVLDVDRDGDAVEDGFLQLFLFL